MGRITISELYKKLDEAKAKRAQLQEQKQAAEKEAGIYAEKMEAAADAGDLAAYKAAKAAKEDAEGVAYIAGRQITKTAHAVGEAEIRDAWESFRTEYEKTLAKQLAELEKARAAYLKAFREAVESQNGAFVQREKLADLLTGISENGHQVNPDTLAVKTIPNKQVNAIYNTLHFSPEALFFASFQELPGNDPEIEKLRVVLYAHRAFKG